MNTNHTTNNNNNNNSRPILRIKKAKLPQPNRNKSNLYKQQQQTVYYSSQEDDQNIMKNHHEQNKAKWTQSMLQVSYKPQHIIGREKEKQYVNEFIDGCLMKEITNRCLCTLFLVYRCLDISGCPGLGKTVTVMQMIQQIATQINKQKATFHYINCLSLKQPASIYKQLLLHSKGKLQSKKKQPYSLAIQFDSFAKSPRLKRLLFFVIDEVDFLYTKNQNVLYNLVEWCSISDSKFSVIMIANTMDFPQKLAPKITSRMGSWRMCFKPYSSQQLKRIIQKRLQGSNIFEQRAVQFAVKKFSVYTSDLRKIFNILKQVIQNHTDNKKKVTIQQVSQVWNRLVEQQDISYKQQLPEIYLIILDLIKKQGGKMHSYQLLNYLYQKKMKSHEIELALMDMKQMGMVKLAQKQYKGVIGIMATLVHSNV